jgi:flotillin
MSQIGDVTIYGTSGNEMSGLSNNVPTVMKQTFDLVKDATGVDMSNIAMANSLDAKINKNIKLNGQVDVE